MAASSSAASDEALSRAMRGLAHRLNERLLSSERRREPTPAGRRDPWHLQLAPITPRRRP